MIVPSRATLIRRPVIALEIGYRPDIIDIEANRPAFGLANPPSDEIPASNRAAKERQ